MTADKWWLETIYFPFFENKIRRRKQNLGGNIEALHCTTYKVKVKLMSLI